LLVALDEDPGRVGDEGVPEELGDDDGELLPGTQGPGRGVGDAGAGDELPEWSKGAEGQVGGCRGRHVDDGESGAFASVVDDAREGERAALGDHGRRRPGEEGQRETGAE
jgi:hypothetical protein